MLRFLLSGAAALTLLSPAFAWWPRVQQVATVGYAAPVMTSYYPAYYPAPVVTSYYAAPAPVYTSYYAVPAPVFAPAPVVSYYTPAPVVSTYYRPAPILRPRLWVPGVVVGP